MEMMRQIPYQRKADLWKTNKFVDSIGVGGVGMESLEEKVGHANSDIQSTVKSFFQTETDKEAAVLTKIVSCFTQKFAIRH